MAKKKRTPPPVRAKAQPRRASPRVLTGAALVTVAAIVGVVLGFSLTGTGNGSTTAKALPGGASVAQLLKGVPQRGNVLGRSDAPVTVVEYVDLQCPYCQQFETQAAPRLIKNYVRTGKAKIVFRPIAFIGPDSQRGRDAAIAAGKQNKMFDFVQILYLNQGAENSGWLSDSTVDAAASSVRGLNARRLLQQRSSTSTTQQADSVDRQATKDRVVETPTILVGKSGGSLRKVTLASPGDAQSVAAAIDRALR
jgi:protein-disulfide isomerase